MVELHNVVRYLRLEMDGVDARMKHLKEQINLMDQERRQLERWRDNARAIIEHANRILPDQPSDEVPL